MFDFLADYLFTKEEQPTMANFNARFEMLNALKNHWWKRRTVVFSEKLGSGENAEIIGGSYYGTVEYSSGVEISNTGEISLRKPISSVKIDKTSGTSVLLGNYTQKKLYNEYTGKFYYVGEDATFDYSTASPSSVYVNNKKGYLVTSEKSYGDWEYIQSSDRSSYPDSGEQDGYEYQYLGVPFENAVGAPKIETGSYVGTGTYGSSNPNSLTFGFNPKIVMLLNVSRSQGSPPFSQYVNPPTTCPLDYTETYAPYRGFTTSSANSSYGKYVGTTLSWYHKDNAIYQFNESLAEYRYLAIG